jgi:hypothetical protein
MNEFVPTETDVIHVDNTTHAYHHDLLTPATLGAMRIVLASSRRYQGQRLIQVLSPGFLTSPRGWRDAQSKIFPVHPFLIS